MAWRQAGDRPPSEPVDVYSVNTCILHLVPISKFGTHNHLRWDMKAGKSPSSAHQSHHWSSSRPPWCWQWAPNNRPTHPHAPEQLRVHINMNMKREYLLINSLWLGKHIDYIYIYICNGSIWIVEYSKVQCCLIFCRSSSALFTRKILAKLVFIIILE